MPAKPVFTDEQQDMLHTAALRVWKRFKADGKTQKDLALALGLSQQSVSALLRGSYHPGLRIATEIATLDGKELEDMIGAFAAPAASPADMAQTGGAHPNLDVCLRFFAASRQWSPWTIAAARAGFFGATDFLPPEWAGKLDHLEKSLERARKGA